MTDAQLYHRGGNYSRLRSIVNKSAVFHSGLFSDPIIENAMRTAWKLPGRFSHIYDDLTWYGLLLSTPEALPMRYRVHKRELFTELNKSLQYGKEYHSFSTRKAWAGWFYYLHRGLRWTDAHLTDLGHYTYPVTLLGDLVATSFGIGSAPSANFYKERLRRLNCELMPDVPVDYSDGRPWRPMRSRWSQIYCLYYEYPKQAAKLIRKKLSLTESGRSFVKQGAIPVDDFDRVDGVFEEYFGRSFREVMDDSTFPTRIGRTAVTLACVLRYLAR